MSYFTNCVCSIVQMPHESTVAHEQRFVMESPMISRSRTFMVPEVEEVNGISPVENHKVG